MQHTVGTDNSRQEGFLQEGGGPIQCLYLYGLLQIEFLNFFLIIQTKDTHTFSGVMLSHYSSALHGDFGKNWEILCIIIQVCHKDVHQEQEWKHREKQQVCLEKVNDILEMKAKPQPIQSKIGQGRSTCLSLLFIDSWNVLMAAACVPAEYKTHSCYPSYAHLI